MKKTEINLNIQSESINTNCDICARRSDRNRNSPIREDFIIFYSCAENYRSYRDDSGSPFIDRFVEAFNESCRLMEIICMINNKMANEIQIKSKKYIQTPDIRNNATKDFHFIEAHYNQSIVVPTVSIVLALMIPSLIYRIANK